MMQMENKRCLRSRTSLVMGGLLACCLGLSCSSSDDDGPGGGNGDGDMGNGATGSGASAGDGDGDQNGDGDGDGDQSGDGDGDSSTGGGENDPNNSACGLAEPPEDSEEIAELIAELEEKSCKAEEYEAESLPADIFIMFDQSTSMVDHHIIEDDETSPTRWDALTEALKTFVTSDEANGLRIGIQYFALEDSGGASQDGFSCEVSDYATPDVEIAALPGNAQALTQSIDDHFAFGFTPSVPALEGALQYAREWAVENPERATVVVFATDGYPTICDGSISDLEDVADAYAHPEDPTDPMTPPITTYVVGVGEVPNLERVAVAGGTGKAFFVGDCPTAVDDLTATLERVANSPGLCHFDLPELPEGQFLDPNEVALIFNPDDAAPEFVYRVDRPDLCSKGGWYYDDNEEPTEILVCPETCSRFGGGSIKLLLGCEVPNIE